MGGEALAAHTLRAWLVVGFWLLKTAIVAAFAYFVDDDGLPVLLTRASEPPFHLEQLEAAEQSREHAQHQRAAVVGDGDLDLRHSLGD